MSHLNQRLRGLEKALLALSGGRCGLCYDSPVAVLTVLHEGDPNGPGLRRTGVAYLDDWGAKRLTDDLRCLKCGKDAVQMHCLSMFPPEGASQVRKLCLGDDNSTP